MSGRVWDKSRTLKFRAQMCHQGASICRSSLLQLRPKLAVRKINQRLGIPETFWNWVLCPRNKGGRHYLFTARKRSLGQGNVFTGVCLSTGGVSVWCPFLSGCLVPCSFWDDLCPGGSLSGGGLCQWDPPVRWRAGVRHPTEMLLLYYVVSHRTDHWTN